MEINKEKNLNFPDSNSSKEKTIISIITPYYNAGDYINETANSVLNQTFQDFEWIIVDDGSSEGDYKKLKEVEKLDKRIRVYRLDESKYQKRTCTSS